MLYSRSMVGLLDFNYHLGLMDRQCRPLDVVWKCDQGLASTTENLGRQAFAELPIGNLLYFSKVRTLHDIVFALLLISGCSS